MSNPHVNPCFNGISVEREGTQLSEISDKVLILVLMEYQ